MTAALATRPWSDEFRSGCEAKDSLSVSEWADRYRVIPRPSPEAGPWRTSRTPYLREILDAISDPAITSIAVQAGSQLGKTEVLLNAIGYYAHWDPTAMLIVQPDEKAMRGFSKERIGSMFEETPALHGKLSDGARDPDNTIMTRQFAGGYVACAWAGSAASLASRAIRVLLADEIDRWPDTTGKDGDPLAQAIQRTANYHNRKIICVSTPTITGASAIERLFQETDRRQFHVPCPRCGTLQVLRWSGVIYKNAAGDVDLDQVHYRCEHCEERIEEREKASMIGHEAASWLPGPRRAEEPPANPSNRGYHISAICSPWRTWRTLAEEWTKAHANRDRTGKQAFINLKLGETWSEESERISVEQLEKNRETYDAEVPDDVLILTAGVDVQDNRLEVEIVGWGLGRESWGIEYAVIAGDTSAQSTWERLDVFLARSWKKADSRPLTMWCACIDSGGHRTSEVYEFCRARAARNIYATKGRAGQGHPIVNTKPTQTNQARINLYAVGADTGKEAVYSRLALAGPGPGYCHFPMKAGYDDQFFKGLVAERRTRIKKKNGHEKLDWIVTGRNEPLDIRVLATASLELLLATDPGLLERLAAEDAKARNAAPHPPAGGKPRRRLLSKGIDW